MYIMAHEPSVFRPDKPVAPEAALAHSLQQASRSQTIANRIPGLKSSALIVLGFIVFAALQTVALQSVAFSVLGAQSGGGFMTFGAAISWIALVVAIIILLRTRATATAKTCLIIIGAVFAWLTITDLFSFNVIALAIDGFLLWRTFEFYQSVEALEL